MYLRRIIAGFSAVLTALCGSHTVTPVSSITASAAADGGFSSEQIQSCELKPVLSLPELVMTPEEAKSSPNVRISLSVSGAEKKYATVEFWTAFDQRLAIVSDSSGAPSVAKGDAIELFKTEFRPSRYLDSSNNLIDLNGVRVIGSAIRDYGYDGDIFTVTVRLPEDVKDGDVFPLQLKYIDRESSGNSFVNSLFTNQKNDDEGKLMQANLFTNGLKNGFIRIDSNKKLHPVGDTNLDGRVTLGDSMIVLQYIANETKYPLSGEALENADAYGPGDGITGLDAVAIQKYDTGMITSLPERPSK